MKNITQISNISGSVQIGEKNYAGSNITINDQGMFIFGDCVVSLESVHLSRRNKPHLILKNMNLTLQAIKLILL